MNKAENISPIVREQDALAYSHRNALRRLIRCLFVENIIERKRLVFPETGQHAWLPLWERHAVLSFDHLSTAPGATVLNHGAITLLQSDGSRLPIETPEQLIDLLRGSFDFAPSEEGVAGLKADIENSIANDALARLHRAAWNAELAANIASSGSHGLVDYLRRHASVREAAMLLDQWGSLEGHPFYPTWKSKPDLSPAQVIELSPEFNATVSLRLAALRSDSAYMERMPHVASYHAWFAAEFPRLWEAWREGLTRKGLQPAQWLPLPIHSWHLRHYVEREHAADIAEGTLILDGPELQVRPSMSFRTMLPVADDGTPFIKLPMALWLTSEQRSLQAKSIHMGPRISAVILKILDEEAELARQLEIFPEEVAFHYRHAIRQEDRPGRHLSVVYRASRAAFEREDGLLPVTVAALFAGAPGSGRPLAAELIENGGASAAPRQVEDWFRQYARSVVRPVLAMYLLYGIALEAHQQNTSMLFDAEGQARGMLIRDFGDGRTYAPLLEARGHSLRPYVHPGILPTVFRDDIEPVRSFVVDACFVCHLHELILTLNAEYRLQDGALWRVLREETAAAFDALRPRLEAGFWERERDAFLNQPWTARSVLRMHLLKYADYRLQHRLPNPLLKAGEGGPA